MAALRQLVEQFRNRLATSLHGTGIEARWNFDGSGSSLGVNGELASNGRLELAYRGKRQQYSFEMWNSYLSNATVNQQVRRAKSFFPDEHGAQPLIFARYLPLPTAERLVEAGINFLDLAGNIHLALGSTFERTVIGKKESSPARRPDRITSAHAQVLFSLAAYPDWLALPVRDLAARAGISKSHVTNVRQTLLDRGLLHSTPGGFQLAGREQIERELVQSYDLLLRPKLLVGRFRSPIKDHAELLTAIGTHFAPRSLRWSLTGGQAADRLRHFYSGAEQTFFFETVDREHLRELRLLPDRQGDIVILRGFGDVCFWKQVDNVTLAHPWLIYAELLCSPDPRAHEAAAELRQGDPEWF